MTSNHSVFSGSRRLVYLLRTIGLGRTVGLVVSLVEDRILRVFDRLYGVQTSGFIRLEQTSFASKRHAPPTALYGPVNAWAFRKLLAMLNLPRSFRFVDIGSGLGRALFLAAEYGFERVTGVELASELCAVAEKNRGACKLPRECLERISIVEADALRYCETTDDDVFFLFRPFPLDLMKETLRLIKERSAQLGKPMTVIYTERVGPGDSHVVAFADSEVFRPVANLTKLGQMFVVYEIGAPARTAGERNESSALA